MAIFRTYSETIDLNTETDGPSILGLHTPIGGEVYNFLGPFFQAYSKYKYLGCDVTIVNSARLPYDPEQLGRVEGTNYVDPRDSLNPILFKGCHGESLGAILNSMYGGLTTAAFKEAGMDRETLGAIFEDFYYTALGDDSWRKSPIQKTLRIKGLHPLVYNLAANQQLMPSGLNPGDYLVNKQSSSNSPGWSNREPGSPGGSNNYEGSPLIPVTAYADPTQSEAGTTQNKQPWAMFTNGVKRLGWMDTLQIVASAGNTKYYFDRDQVAQLPKLFFGLLVLPKANLCRNYLRVIITHKFKFAKYRTITTGMNPADVSLTGITHGYYDHFTGNIPSGGSKEVLSSNVASAAGADVTREELELDNEVVEDDN